MNRQIDDNELLHEIAPYAGKASDVLLKIIRQWQSSLPALEDTLTSNDIIEKAKTDSQGIHIKKLVAMFATGIAAIVIAGVMLFTHYFSGTMEKAVCTAVIGDVQVIRGNQSVPLMNGMGIEQRDRIVCGKGSMAVIEIGSLKLRIDQNSEFAIDTVQSKGKLLLDTSMTRGVIYATIAKLKKGDSVFVKTKTAVASIRGTTFMIKSNNNITKLIVLEGKVMIAPRLDSIPQESTPGVVVDAGQACVVDAGTIIAIKKAVSMNTTELDTIIQQSLPVTIADKKIIQIIETLTRDINQTMPVSGDELTLNTLYNIKAVVPDNNDVLVTTSDGLYYCKDYKVEWMYSLPMPSKPFKWDTMYILQSKDLYAIDRKGDVLWQCGIEGEVLDDGILRIKNTIIVPTSKGLLYFIDKKGKVIHRVDCNAPFITKPVLFNQMVCIVTDDGYLYAIDISLGVSIYRKHIGTVIENGLIAQYPEIYFVTPDSIQKLHVLKDELVWSFNDSNIIDAIAYDTGIVYATTNGSLCKLSANGDSEWRISPGKSIHSLKSIHNGITCIADTVFYLIASNGEVLWSYTLPSSDATIVAVTPKMVFICTENRLLTLKI